MVKRKKPAKKVVDTGLRTDITGMLFVRDTSEKPLSDGRRLVMVVGVLALPADADLPGEHQFIVSGSDVGDVLSLVVFKEPRFDRTEEARGRGIGDTLLLPIWRH